MSFVRFASTPRGMFVLLGGLLLVVFAGSFMLGRALNQQAQPPELPDEMFAVSPPITLTDFTLTGTDGQPMTLSDLRGKLSVVFFGYTNCPDVCPMTMAEYAETLRLLGDDAARVNLVFVSVDGVRDTPERVGEWLSGFDSRIVGMSGTPDELEVIGNRFGLIVQRVTIQNGTSVPLPTPDHSGHTAGAEVENYFIEHTSPSFIVDADGVLRYIYYFGTPADVMAAGLRELLAG